jgi:hypothetical protein
MSDRGWDIRRKFIEIVEMKDCSFNDSKQFVKYRTDGKLYSDGLAVRLTIDI